MPWKQGLISGSVGDIDGQEPFNKALFPLGGGLGGAIQNLQ